MPVQNTTNFFFSHNVFKSQGCQYSALSASSPFPKQQSLDSSKLKEFAKHIFKFYENGRKFSKWVENTV